MNERRDLSMMLAGALLVMLGMVLGGVLNPRSVGASEGAPGPGDTVVISTKAYVIMGYRGRFYQWAFGGSEPQPLIDLSK